MPDKKDWEYLGAGSYNTAYRSKDRLEVLKIQKRRDDETDRPERSVRLWEQLNPIPPGPPPPPYMCEHDGKLGWVCPFVVGRQSTDDEMSAALIDIYTRSGRIVVDATAPKNFVTTPPTEKYPDGQVVCVDIGMALALERREDEFFAKSLTSLNAWGDLNEVYDGWLPQYSRTYPHTVDTVKALLFIKINRPDIMDVDFLKNDYALIARLSSAYTKQRLNSNVNVNDHLDVLTEKIIQHQVKSISSLTSSPTPGLTSSPSFSLSPTPPPANPSLVPPTASSTEGTWSDATKQEYALDLLNNLKPITMESIRQSCTTELERYINSRGSLNYKGEFSPSWITRIFRNQALTQNKVAEAKSLISEINKAREPDEIIKAFDKYKKNCEAFTVGILASSGFESCVGRCRTTALTALNNPSMALTKTATYIDPCDL